MNCDHSSLGVRCTYPMHHDGPCSFVDTVSERVSAALEVAHCYGGIDGEHHKTWVIDQMVRALTGDDYAEWVRAQKAGDDGPETYNWDEGIAP